MIRLSEVCFIISYSVLSRQLPLRLYNLFDLIKYSPNYYLLYTDNPNEYILAMQVLVYCYILLIVTGYPILMFSDNNAAFSCVQPLAFFGTFFTLVSLQLPFILFERLDNPFDAHDDINAENLVASTELALFNSMRCQFRDISAESDVDGDYELRSERTLYRVGLRD